MPYYVGDSIEISAAASDFDGNAVTGASGSARLSILEIGGDAKPVPDAEMLYSGPDSAFVYVWETAGLPDEGGGYRAKIEVTVGTRKSVEIRPIVVYSTDPD